MLQSKQVELLKKRQDMQAEKEQLAAAQAVDKLETKKIVMQQKQEAHEAKEAQQSAMRTRLRRIIESQSQATQDYDGAAAAPAELEITITT